jgi:hypothetical protein
MKYFRAVNRDDVTDVLYLSSNLDLDAKRFLEEKTRIGNYGYELVECSQEEFEAMTQEENDYIINVGNFLDDLTPFASAHSYEEGVEKGEKLLEDWKFVELIYMPQDNEDINEVVWSKNR